MWSGVLTDSHARVRILSSDLYKKLAGSTVVANYPFSCDTFKKNTFKNIRQHFEDTKKIKRKIKLRGLSLVVTRRYKENKEEDKRLES